MMSYVSAYENKTPRSKGVIMAAVVHAVIIGGVIAMPGIEIPERFEGPIFAFPVPVDKPPEPIVEETPPEVKTARPTVQAPPDKPRIELTPPPIVPIEGYARIDLATGSDGTGDEIPFQAIEVEPDPVIVAATLNQRYASHFQPAYPTGQLRLEREGEVSVRVLVGTDGRVKNIELIDSPHADFWTATRKQALSKWRFTPATSDGKPIESWMTLKVRFEINS
ncbi:TonB family protein [Parasphingorhabdus sp.]|uniref:energy transducer TonB n=3 Tax=Parasphingorhabdus sp. TaxID=2709688 RepID=UPI0032661211